MLVNPIPTGEKGGRNRFMHALAFQFLKFLAILSLLLSLNILSVAAENKILTVGVYENAPKIFTSETGQPSGIFIDTIESIARSEGWTVKYVPGTWAKGLDRLAKGEIDLMPDVAYTTDREKIYAFHKVPVLSVWSQVYAHRGSGIQSILDLNGKRVAALEQTIQLETFKRLTNSFGLRITLIPVPDYKTEFEMVSQGKADAGITNRFYGLMNARKFGLEDTPVIFDPAPFFFAAPKGDPKHLLAAIDRRLIDLKTDSQSAYYASLKRWTSEEVRFRLPLWLQMSGLAAAVVLFMSLLGSIILKREVNARTRELRQINEETEQRVVERTAELAKAMEKAQESDRLKSAFLATMSHELRTPLNSIIGFTGIMLQGLVGPLNEEQTKQMNLVRTSAHHLLSLINDVLDISKIEAGQLKVALEPFDLPTSIHKVAQTVRPLAEKKGLALLIEIAPDVGMIKSDVRRVEQVLLNLLSNAVKFTEAGRVTVTCAANDGDYVIRVADTGIGIKEDELEGLFKPFHQVNTGLNRKYEGTGLGLSICKKLTELLGGHIGIASEWQKGSTFSVSIPVERILP